MIILPAHQAYYSPTHPHPHPHPHSKAEDTMPIMLNDDSLSPYPYPSSSNEHTPVTNPPRTFSPPAHHLARMPERNQVGNSQIREYYQDRRMERDMDRDRDVGTNRDITTSHPRAAIDGTQNSGINVSSPAPSSQNLETKLENSGMERTKSPRVGGENRSLKERDREKKKRKGAKRMSVINDQDQDEDQWPGEF